MLKLIEPTLIHKEEIEYYRSGFLKSAEDCDGSSMLLKYDNIEEWLAHLKRMKDPHTCPQGLVPATHFVLVNYPELKILGMLDIRHELNDALFRYGGHIGYSVAIDERKKGYGTYQLKLGLDICRQMKLKRVLITTDETNLASQKIILHNNGQLENVVLNPETMRTVYRYWITL